MELGGQRGNGNTQWSITDPTGRISKKARHCSSHKKSNTLGTQPMRKCHQPEHLLFSNGLSFKTTPLLPKIMFPLKEFQA